MKLVPEVIKFRNGFLFTPAIIATNAPPQAAVREITFFDFSLLTIRFFRCVFIKRIHQFFFILQYVKNRRKFRDFER